MRIQDFLSSMPYHTIFGFLIPLLVGVLQVSVQGITKSSFEAYPAKMWTFLLATTAYCFAFAADMKSKDFQESNSDDGNCSQLFGAAAIISGSLASVSVVSIFIPSSLAYTIFILWAFVSTVVAYNHANSIKESCNLLRQKIENAYQKTRDKINSLKEQRLPL